MKGDPFCAKKSGKDEEIVAGSGGQLKNVVVRITKGAKGEFPAPTEEAVLDQDGCMYKPRVVVVQAGQNVAIKNSDQTLHNVHTYKGPVTLFNQAQPQGFPPLKKKFPTTGDVVKFKCDVHPWMTGYVVVTDNPFHSVTGEDGSFTIKDVPPGTYTIEAWHERLGTKSAEITVAADKAAETKFEFAAK
jgi:plastocyanin